MKFSKVPKKPQKVWATFQNKICHSEVFKNRQIWSQFPENVRLNNTRFGISLCLWQIFDSLFLIWQNAQPTLAICDIIGQIFIAENGQILKKQSGHLVTLHLEHVYDRTVRNFILK